MSRLFVSKYMQRSLSNTKTAKSAFLIMIMIIMTQLGYLDSMNPWTSGEETLDETNDVLETGGSGTVFTGNGTQWQPAGMDNSGLYPKGGSWNGYVGTDGAINTISDDMAIFAIGNDNTGQTAPNQGCFKAYSHTNYSTWHIKGDSNYHSIGNGYCGGTVEYGPTIDSITYLATNARTINGVNNNNAQLFAYNRTNDSMYLVAELNGQCCSPQNRKCYLRLDLVYCSWPLLRVTSVNCGSMNQPMVQLGRHLQTMRLLP